MVTYEMKQAPPCVGSSGDLGSFPVMETADIFAERFETIALQFPSLSFCADEE